MHCVFFIITSTQYPLNYNIKINYAWNSCETYYKMVHPKGSPQGNGVNVLILCATKDYKTLGVIVGSTHWDKKTCENSRMGQG
jgi:hypothetical protein